jgi:hypothetical protein
MELIFEFTYRALCLTGALMAYTSFHYFMQRRITHSLTVKHHSEIMMALCFVIALSVAILVCIPHL